MPYIKTEARVRLANGNHPKSPGELNYKITQLLYQYVDDSGLNYLTINDVLGALEGAKAEFYRRVAGPYEDTKREENGDVFV